MENHKFFTDTIKLGKKGQLTIPKSIRDEDNLKENDKFIVTHTSDGEIILQKKNIKTPEDLMLEAVKKAPKFNWRKSWKEIKEERKKERS